MSPKLKKIYQGVEKTLEFGDMQTNYEIVSHVWLAQIAGGHHPDALSDHKLKVLKRLIRGELKGQQLVLWFNFNRELLAVSKALIRMGLSVGKIYGKIKPKERHILNYRFNNGDVDALCVQVKTSRYGRDFSAAEASIFYSLPWDLLGYMQARDRILHPDKIHPGLTIHLITADSIDEDVLYALRLKRNLSVGFKSAVTEHMKRRLEWEESHRKIRTKVN